MSQLYNINRPPPVPLTEYEQRRKRRDLEDILQARVAVRGGSLHIGRLVQNRAACCTLLEARTHLEAWA